MKVIAFQGQGATPRMLQKDMGDPDWVDMYWDYRNPYFRLQRFIGVCYSISGSILAKHTLERRFRELMVGLILYECPILDDIIPLGDFPILSIWNERSFMLPSRKREMDDSIKRWSLNHPVEVKKAYGGRGLLFRHLEPKPYWPFVGHAWDRGINSYAQEWVERIKYG